MDLGIANSGYGYDSHVKGINKRFLVKEDEEEPERLAFLHHLCQRLELVHIAGGFLKPNPPEAKRWLKATRAEQLRAAPLRASHPGAASQWEAVPQGHDS